MTHEIVLRTRGHLLLLSCTCLRIAQRGRHGWAPIDTRPILPAAVALALWRRWHEREGIPLQDNRR